MAALITFLATLLFAPPTTIENDPVVRQMERIAAPSYREAIEHALDVVDPDREHPVWRIELWRICKREAWCGKFGPVKVHKIDGWVGVGAWVHAVRKGYLDPETCPEHRLDDYLPAVEYLADLEGKAKRQRYKERLIDLADRIASFPKGQYTPEDFATRGGFGMNAARGLRRLGQCVAPTSLDDPKNAALVAAKAIASCETWDGPKGRRYKRPCTCVDHTRRWVGGGRFDARSLVGQWKTVERQCGPAIASEFAYERTTALLKRIWTYVRIGITA